MRRRAFLAQSLGLAAFAVAWPACSGNGSGTLTVAAAADLRDALESMKPSLVAATGARATFVFGSSGQLKQQIAGGARFDLFLSADAGYVQDLSDAGRTLTAVEYATGRLALAWRDGLGPFASVDDLARPEVRRVAIAQPDHAPYGRAAKEALTNAGLWGRIEPRLVYAENVRQAVDYVEGGNADAGLVALALIIRGERFSLIPKELHQPIRQTGAVIRGTRHERAARDFLTFLAGSVGRAALRDFGFEAPAS